MTWTIVLVLAAGVWGQRFLGMYVGGPVLSRYPALGKLATLVFEEGRPGSSRSRKVWFAPELGYVPVRMEYRRKGKTAAVMTIQSLQRPQERAAAVQCEAPPSNALSASEG